MKYGLILALTAGLVACLAISCDKPEDPSKTAADPQLFTTPMPSGKPKNREPGLGAGLLALSGQQSEDQLADGGFDLSPNIHIAAREAWLLVETSYLVIEERWNESAEMISAGDPDLKEKGMLLRQETGDAIDNVVFGINETVEELFKEAIAQEPDSPENLATYAFYLKPRRRWVDQALIPTDIQAFELLDQAIEMDPENSLWYLMKIHFMTSPQVCHNWFREYALEEQAIQRWLPDIKEFFDKAEGYAPDNGYINYYNALLLNKFAPYDPQFPQKAELMREIRAGNKKEYVNFFFPPPLPPFSDVFYQPIIREKNNAAVFVDHWNQFSMLDTQDVDALLARLAASMSWPEDKEDIGELMVMLYQLGRIQPYDRSFFALQLKLLQPFAEQVDKGSDEALKLAETIRYLNDQYHTVANQFYNDGLIDDPAKVGVIGIHDVERGYSHRSSLAHLTQPHQKAFLMHAAEVLGLDYQLFDQPNIT